MVYMKTLIWSSRLWPVVSSVNTPHWSEEVNHIFLFPIKKPCTIMISVSSENFPETWSFESCLLICLCVFLDDLWLLLTYRSFDFFSGNFVNFSCWLMSKEMLLALNESFLSPSDRVSFRGSCHFILACFCSSSKRTDGLHVCYMCVTKAAFKRSRGGRFHG